MNKLRIYLNKYWIEIIVLIFALLFSSWLMFSSFSFKDGSMLISSKSWSDFANHIPLIRSFSFGENFPPQYPLFSGPPIKYHFLFYFIVGLMEKVGFRIDYALNIPSILGFTFLLFMIYLFSKHIFKSKAVGIISIILFLFNGSLSFVNFFAKNPLSSNTFNQILKNTSFPSFGPYDGQVISAFWNLNIYTNQRHLAISYGLSLLIIYLLLKFKTNDKYLIFKSIAIGIILGLSFVLNMAVFLMTITLLSCIFLFLTGKRKFIFICLIIGIAIAIPQYIYTQSSESIFKISINPGYLVKNLNTINFINYWVQNIGLNIILIPLGFIIANKLSKKILISFFSLFLIGSFLQFSPEIAANHKFFNYFMIIGVMFSSCGLVYLWKKKNILKPITLVLFFFLIFSGIIDFFPVLNDNKITLLDYHLNNDAAWIKNHTPPNSIFLNTSFLYNDASIVGRKIFLGWPYFAWSQGYDTTKRDQEIRNFFSLKDNLQICEFLHKNNISYIFLDDRSKDYVYNKSFWMNFNKIYVNNSTQVTIIASSSICL